MAFSVFKVFKVSKALKYSMCLVFLLIGFCVFRF